MTITSRKSTTASADTAVKAVPDFPAVALKDDDGNLIPEVLAYGPYRLTQAEAEKLAKEKKPTKYLRFHIRTFPGNKMATDAWVVAAEGTYEIPEGMAMTIPSDY